MNWGDYDASAVVYGKFTTFKPTTGAPFVLAGTPALSVYKDNSTTQSTTGVTLTADFDSVAGLNHFAIDTSADGTFYSAGSFFDIVITTGTVDSVSAVGMVVGRFTIRKNSALKPTTAGRALDVSAGGEAGVDWANVGSPTTAVDLSGTTIKTTQKVDVETIKTQAVTAAAGVTFPSSIASPTNITAGTITTATNLTNAPTAGDLTAAMKASVNAEADTAILDAALVTKLDAIDDFVDTEVAAILAAVDTEVAAIKTKTDSLTFTVANVVDANVSNVNGSTTGVDKLAAHLPSVLKLVVGVGSTTTAVVFSTVNGGAGSAVDDFYNGAVIVFTSGALSGQRTSISDYTGSSTTATVVTLTGAPANGVTAVIV